MRFIFLLVYSIIFSNLAFSKTDFNCDYKEKKSTSGGYREIFIGTITLTDVESLILFDKNLFYATSPVYGVPEVGVIKCANKTKVPLVSAKHKTKAYPEGTDFFRLKNILKINAGVYRIYYYSIDDVDSSEFSNLEKKI